MFCTPLGRQLSFSRCCYKRTAAPVSPWRGYRRNRVSLNCKGGDQERRVLEGEEEREFAWSKIDAPTMIQGSSVFYGAMTVSAVFLGRLEGLHVFDDLIAPVDVVGGLVWTVPMVLSLAVTISLTDRFPSLMKIKRLLQETLLPLLRKMPPWGPLVLAVGAGIGEESLFRGWMQPAIAHRLMDISPEYASLCGILSTSVIFGLFHAVTKTYFVWATVFGALMGVECATIGLPAAAFTHALYDWIAFVSLKEVWNPKNEENRH